MRSRITPITPPSAPRVCGKQAALLAVLLATGFATAGVSHAQPAPGAPESPAARKRPPLRVATLSNGLRLLCRSNDAAEIVSVVCLVRAGLPDESAEQSGLAALTAEALIKGTTTHPGTSFNTAVMNAGGNLRSQPGFDLTEIGIVTSREQFEPALKVIADVVAHPRFSKEDVDEARQTLKRRLASVQDDFTGASYQALVGQLYRTSPYGRPMLGFPETLDRLTVEDVRSFWQANYVQNRTVVSIVGDVDSGRALTVAQKAFQDVPFKPAAGSPPPPAQTLERPRLELVERAVPEGQTILAQVMVGYLAPAATRENYPVFALLDAIVGGGKRARLFANIREKESLGYEVGSFYQPLRYQSHLVGYVVGPPVRRNPRTEQVENVIDLVKTHLLEQFRELAAAGPTDQELARARAYVIGRYALRQERTRDQAKWLAWNEAMGLGRDFDDRFTARVQSLTKEEIQAAAKRVLNNYALVLTVPKPS
jgi:zinc protease